jgi:hypothetical protein
MTPNKAVLAPIPRATVRIAAMAKAGFWRRERSAERMHSEYRKTLGDALTFYTSWV